MNRTTLLLLAGIVLGPGRVLAHPPGRHPGAPRMAARCSEMMTDMKAMDARLDEKLAAVNAAQGEAKVDAMATFLAELVSQRKTMHQKMADMPAGAGCPMMPH
jgi:hypothetical protein